MLFGKGRVMKAATRVNGGQEPEGGVLSDQHNDLMTFSNTSNSMGFAR